MCGFTCSLQEDYYGLGINENLGHSYSVRFSEMLDIVDPRKGVTISFRTQQGRCTADVTSFQAQPSRRVHKNLGLLLT